MKKHVICFNLIILILFCDNLFSQNSDSENPVVEEHQTGEHINKHFKNFCFIYDQSYPY